MLAFGRQKVVQVVQLSRDLALLLADDATVPVLDEIRLFEPPSSLGALPVPDRDALCATHLLGREHVFWPRRCA